MEASTCESQSATKSPSSNIPNRPPAKQSYVAATVRDQFPTKDQAIVIESVPYDPIDQCTQEIGKLVTPASIRFVSRISGNRICMYLDSKQTVEDLTNKHTSIIINDNLLELRPLLTKSKRLILSNVCPVIPHYPYRCTRKTKYPDQLTYDIPEGRVDRPRLLPYSQFQETDLHSS